MNGGRKLAWFGWLVYLRLKSTWAWVDWVWVVWFGAWCLTGFESFIKIFIAGYCNTVADRSWKGLWGQR